MKPGLAQFLFLIFNIYSWDYLIHRDFWGRENLVTSLLFCLSAVLNIAGWATNITKSPRWARGVELALALIFGMMAYTFYQETVLLTDTIGLVILYGGTVAAVFRK